MSFLKVSNHWCTWCLRLRLRLRLRRRRTDTVHSRSRPHSRHDGSARTERLLVLAQARDVTAIDSRRTRDWTGVALNTRVPESETSHNRSSISVQPIASGNLREIYFRQQWFPKPRSDAESVPPKRESIGINELFFPLPKQKHFSSEV